eukprot:m.694152 g.694152  ORF g.694152 m.694152 type:complete len:98 (+) comp22878_c0_seq1:260-553(+)
MNSHWIGRLFFDLTFFLIVPVFVLNIILAIIIDSFAEQRDSKSKWSEFMSTTCFVCGWVCACCTTGQSHTIVHVLGPQDTCPSLSFQEPCGLEQDCA